MGERTRNYDWSKTQLGSPDQWPLSLRITLGLLLHSAFPMVLFWGDQLTCFYNDAFRPGLGVDGKHPALGKGAQDMWGEIWTFIGPLIKQVMQTGEPVYFEDQLVSFYRNGHLEDIYWTFSYSPAYGDASQINGVLVTCTETTQAVLGRNKLEQSDTRFRSLIEEAPVATGLFVGREMVIEVANEAMISFFGKGRSILGKPIREVLTATHDQGALQLLDNVFDTGKPFEATGAPAQLTIDGVPGTYYFDFSLKPLLNMAGEVYAILEMAIEVTEEVLARQRLEETESELRDAVELAQLGTWSIDVTTNGLTYSDRLIEWFGYNPGEQNYSQVIPILKADDQERVSKAVAWALNPESNGIYDEIYTVIHPNTGKERILHAQGRTVFDATGKAIRLNGTTQDITVQWELQMALENEVQQRTRELAIKIKELEEANRLLNRSNENLQQFAYVASHDLQEPLRKIQQFGDLLRARYTDALSEELTYVQRMQSAASRMSTLIRDLLSFSRISTGNETSTPVSLNEVVHTVLTDLELVITETGAVINVGSLPTVWGDATQLGQLVQNILSNALKFRRAGVIPLIQINAYPVQDTALPPSVKPARAVSAYYRIDVVDNGIGFDEKYIDRIFEVFQRLHGKSEFTGTGIGLAICERVATNHGGAITATSQPGQGATFSVFFPR